MSRLDTIPTPSLVLDKEKVQRNCARMLDRARDLGVVLRPHLKTAKSVDVARFAVGGASGPITVSTLNEAAYFAARGFLDITYAVGVTASKVTDIADLSARYGAQIGVITDSIEGLEALDQAALGADIAVQVSIEIDSGAGRGGVTAEGPELLELARRIASSRTLKLAGVLTHAGHSYAASGSEMIRQIAEDERQAATRAAARLRAIGSEVASVSVGSTPTAIMAHSLDGVTEMRPGVYTLFDLDQVALGTCDQDDIAVAVLGAVVGHNPRSRTILIDAGALALSKDLSASHFDPQIGYGLVCDIEGDLVPGVRVADVHQEHGFVRTDGSFDELAARFPVGSRVRILPNHVCMTAAPFDKYYVVGGKELVVQETWDKASGWVVPREVG